MSVCMLQCQLGMIWKFFSCDSKLSVCIFCMSPWLSVSVCLSVCLPACLSECASMWTWHYVGVLQLWLSCLSLCLCVCVSVCLPVCLCLSLSVCLSVRLFVCLYVCLSVCLSVCDRVFCSVSWVWCGSSSATTQSDFHSTRHLKSSASTARFTAKVIFLSWKAS